MLCVCVCVGFVSSDDPRARWWACVGSYRCTVSINNAARSAGFVFLKTAIIPPRPVCGVGVGVLSLCSVVAQCVSARLLQLQWIMHSVVERVSSRYTWRMETREEGFLESWSSRWFLSDLPALDKLLKECNLLHITSYCQLNVLT